MLVAVAAYQDRKAKKLDHRHCLCLSHRDMLQLYYGISFSVDNHSILVSSLSVCYVGDLPGIMGLCISLLL